MSILEVKNLKKNFGSLEVLKGIDFSLEKGEALAMIGASGSGKTTVAKELQKKFGYNTMLISQDEIRRNILRVKDGIDTKALPLMIELLKYGYEHSDIVIL